MGAKQQGADATQGRWMVIPRTLCFVTHGDQVLLMKRSANKRVFPNQYNGLGGHIERDEDVYSSARREIYEESGLEVQGLRLCGIHNIDAGAQNGILLFVFVAESTSMEYLITSEEGTLHWVKRDHLSQIDLVEDVAHILARILPMSADAPPYFAHVSYDPQDVIQMRYAE